VSVMGQIGIAHAETDGPERRSRHTRRGAPAKSHADRGGKTIGGSCWTDTSCSDTKLSQNRRQV